MAFVCTMPSRSLTNRLMIVFYILFSIFILPITQSIETNISVRILLSNHANAATFDLDLTLWWNRAVYECRIFPWGDGGIYWCTQYEWEYIGDSCDDLEGEYKMMLDNSDSMNAAIIDSITLGFSDRSTWYQIAGWCLRNDSVPNGYTTEPSWEWTGSSNNCQSGFRQFNSLCIDGDSDDCAPGKQMIYFDVNAPNQTRYDSPLDDASNIAMDFPTCDPTKSPTRIPSTLPTNSPNFRQSLNLTLESEMDHDGVVISTTSTTYFIERKPIGPPKSRLGVIMVLMMTVMVLCVISSILIHINWRMKRTSKTKQEPKDKQKLVDQPVHAEVTEPVLTKCRVKRTSKTMKGPMDTHKLVVQPVNTDIEEPALTCEEQQSVQDIALPDSLDAIKPGASRIGSGESEELFLKIEKWTPAHNSEEMTLGNDDATSSSEGDDDDEQSDELLNEAMTTHDIVLPGSRQTPIH